ncbi:related to alpha-ketoglutarate-dependent taurine dioxygenase [Armillaria ostoyae]|uniref:Related to alpha-ketoglutarate-dependent taurine dioxygenase n=1 Tax=Armillaria ostoyae TaxID=47428 RepID=A0A284RJ62_ARMOS|nr:related to alpha-ketoglutarate-dependent taurine dioxygenase [Armillaria ostoyae]
MAPVATAPTPVISNQPIKPVYPKEDANFKLPPANTLKRYEKAGVDISQGYPFYPPKPDFYQDVAKLQTDLRDYVDPATRADPEKKALFGAAKEVRDLSIHIGTEIVGLQLSELTDKQRDELALLVAERSVVFFRDQDLSPQKQRELGLYLGQDEVEVHPQVAQVPGLPGVSLIWEAGRKDKEYKEFSKAGRRGFRHAYPSGSYGWHTDLVHLAFPPGYTHLHQDTVPPVGGDTLWASGYSAYDKFSPAFRKLLDGLNGIYRSAHQYKDANDPDAPPRHVETVHPLVRTHPVTGFKTVFANRSMTVGIEGFDRAESDAILNHIHDVYERSTDIQIRWHWTPGTSAIWDNRITIHTVSYDYEGKPERHGTRVSSLAEKPFFDPSSKSRREALKLDD